MCQNKPFGMFPWAMHHGHGGMHHGYSGIHHGHGGMHHGYSGMHHGHGGMHHGYGGIHHGHGGMHHGHSGMHHGNCGCGCQGFGRNLQTKQELIEKFESYQQQLELELKAVKEHLELLKK